MKRKRRVEEMETISREVGKTDGNRIIERKTAEATENRENRNGRKF